MIKLSAPLVVALALAAPAAGWFAMEPALRYSVSTQGTASASAGSPFASQTNPVAAALNASQGEFQAGIQALKDGNAAQAISARDNLMPRDGLERKTLTYAIVTSGLSGISAEEYLAARETLSGWPGLDGLERHYERALYREHPSNDVILSAFHDHVPETAEGNVLLARALQDLGEKDKAKAIIENMWTSKPLNRWLEGEVRKYFGNILTAQDYRTRMDYLLYRDRVKQAARFADQSGAKPLFDAWSAVILGSRKAPQLLKTADKDFHNDPALLFANITYLQQKEDYQAAAKLLEQTPADAGKRVNSDEWWHQQRIVARGLYEDGKPKESYKLVDNYVADSAPAKADAEFHAGWFALVGLKDAALARRHFRALLNIASTPTTTAKAYYWLGRAEKAAGENAQAAFRHAAAFDHTFYGLVAGASLEKSIEPSTPATPTQSDHQHFAKREAVCAIALFEKQDFNAPARALYRGLAEKIQSPAELVILAEQARTNQDNALALEIGKKAYDKGADSAALAFPLGAIPEDAQLSGTQLALAYAVARQESGFNQKAVSAARAQGIMQILPQTAKDVANQIGLAFAPEKLKTDSAYNAILGTQYLDNQIKRHNGSYVLTFAAYNAGPAKVREWVHRFGDPRGKSMEEVLNWIVLIPYPETRYYVEHVLENFEAYQRRLGLKANIADDLTAGT